MCVTCKVIQIIFLKYTYGMCIKRICNNETTKKILTGYKNADELWMILK